MKLEKSFSIHEGVFSTEGGETRNSFQLTFLERIGFHNLFLTVQKKHINRDQYRSLLRIIHKHIYPEI